jgi:3-hydroxyisobutyrate dehydrogenase
MVKDIHIALDLAGSTSVPTRHAAATVELWDEALAALGPTADHTEIARWLRERKETA